MGEDTTIILRVDPTFATIRKWFDECRRTLFKDLKTLVLGEIHFQKRKLIGSVYADRITDATVVMSILGQRTDDFWTDLFLFEKTTA